MRATLPLAALAAAVILPAVAPSQAHAYSCAGQRDRQVLGTVLGGVGGALIGNSIARGGGGAVIGGLGGAVVGHELTKPKCGRGYARTVYRDRPPAQAETPRAVRYVYYDQYGNPVSAGAAPQTTAAYGQPTNLTSVSYAPACRSVNRSFYNERGALVQRAVQVCDR